MPIQSGKPSAKMPFFNHRKTYEFTGTSIILAEDLHGYSSIDAGMFKTVLPLRLRRCATSRTVPGSLPAGVTGFFSDIFPSDQIMALRSTQPLVKMSTRNIPGGKGGRCVRLTNYHYTVPLSIILDPSGHA